VPCVPALKPLLEAMHKAVILPYYCSDNFVNARDIGAGINFIVQGST